jgi:C4-dicarboxylate transporter, DctM subunit
MVAGSPHLAQAPHAPAGAQHRFARTLDRGVTALGIAAMAAFAAVMLLGVFCRYVLNASLAWSDEVATILFGWSTFLFIASAYLHGEHVFIDVLVSKMTGRALRVTKNVSEGLALGYLFCLGFSCFQAWGILAMSRTDALQLPSTLHFAVIPCSVFVMLVYWADRNVSLPGLLWKLCICAAFVAAATLPIGAYLQVVGFERAVVIVVSLFGPMIVGVPVAISLGIAAMIYIALDPSPAFSTAALQIFNGMNVLVLVAIPLLILSGKLMHRSGIARRLVELAMVLVGRIRGGLGAANVVASFLFGDISGSAVSDTAAIGALMIPEMKRRGYRASFAAALQGAAGTLGMTAPLSITILLYAGATNASISHLAAAMVVPSILLACSFIGLVLWQAAREGYPKESVPQGVILSRVLNAFPGILALALVLGGILGGIFTPAEVGAILVAYVLVLGICLYRSVGPRDLEHACIEAGHISGMTIFLVCTSGLLGFVMSRDMVSEHIAQFLAPLAANRFELLVVLCAVFLVLGMFLEPPAIIFGFLPSFLPLLMQARIDLTQWGVLLALNAGIGFILPPVGLNLFVATKLADVPYTSAMRAALPFVAVMILNLLVLAAVPGISLWLPHLFFAHPIQ